MGKTAISRDCRASAVNLYDVPEDKDQRCRRHHELDEPIPAGGTEDQCTRAPVTQILNVVLRRATATARRPSG
jgi:hypothetical protein